VRSMGGGGRSGFGLGLVDDGGLMRLFLWWISGIDCLAVFFFYH